MVQVKGRVAWVSGGAQGIGLAATKQLIARGAKVVMVDICNYTLGQKSVVEANKAAGTLGGSAVFFRADVTDTDQVIAILKISGLRMHPCMPVHMYAHTSYK